MKKIKNNNKGFTLVEMIVTIAIIGIFGAGLLEMMISSQRAKDSVEQKIEYQLVAADIMSAVRAQLANVSALKVIDSADIDLTDTYVYLVSDRTVGGLTIHDYDETTATRTTGVIRNDSDPEYGSYVVFKQESNWISVTVDVVQKDDTGAYTSNILYEESTKIAVDSDVLEELGASANQQPAVRFKRIT